MTCQNFHQPASKHPIWVVRKQWSASPPPSLQPPKQTTYQQARAHQETPGRGGGIQPAWLLRPEKLAIPGESHFNHPENLHRLTWVPSEKRKNTCYPTWFLKNLPPPAQVARNPVNQLMPSMVIGKLLSTGPQACIPQTMSASQNSHQPTPKPASPKPCQPAKIYINQPPSTSLTYKFLEKPPWSVWWSKYRYNCSTLSR